MAKVRIKSTGEVLDFAPYSLVSVHRPGTPEYEYMEYVIDEVEIIPDHDDEYSYRNEFAKVALQALMLHGNNSEEWIARRSFEIADAMIKQSKT